MRASPIRMGYNDFITQQEEGGIGYCTVCHEQHEDYVDPDGRDILCRHCGVPSVHGLEEMLVIGMIEFTGDDE